MNIDLLNQTLEVAENPGLDTLDPRFGDIAGLVENGDYLGAAGQAEEILADGVYDIRISGYFLYGHFIEEGIAAVSSIFHCLANLLTENWEAFGPVKNREKHTQTSLNWFLGQLLKKLQYEENKESDIWNRWSEEVSSADVQEALDAAEAFQKALVTALEDNADPLLDGLSRINDWFRAFQRLVYQEPEPEDASEPEDTSEPETETGEPQKGASQISDLSSEDTAFAQGSYHLKLLLKKMEAFKQLIENEQVPKAAIVADDINHIIADFDPRIYFPKMFSQFSLLLALNIRDLTAFEDYKGSVEWQTMQDLYRVDLDSFVSFDSEISYSSTPSDRTSPEEGQAYESEDDEDETHSEHDESQDEWG